MKKLNIISIITLCAIIVFLSNISISTASDFSSNHITIENDVKATKEKLHPVLLVTNNTDTDLKVTYDFYVHKTDTQELSKDILVKANETVVLEIPELHHLGDTRESRTIWFSWMEKRNLKPLQNQIETAIFANPSNVELGLN